MVDKNLQLMRVSFTLTDLLVAAHILIVDFFSLMMFAIHVLGILTYFIIIEVQF